jgi:hypothetical protein
VPAAPSPGRDQGYRDGVSPTRKLQPSHDEGRGTKGSRCQISAPGATRTPNLLIRRCPSGAHGCPDGPDHGASRSTCVHRRPWESAGNGSQLGSQPERWPGIRSRDIDSRGDPQMSRNGWLATQLPAIGWILLSSRLLRGDHDTQGNQRSRNARAAGTVGALAAQAPACPRPGNRKRCLNCARLARATSGPGTSDALPQPTRSLSSAPARCAPWRSARRDERHLRAGSE